MSNQEENEGRNVIAPGWIKPQMIVGMDDPSHKGRVEPSDPPKSRRKRRTKAEMLAARSASEVVHVVAPTLAVIAADSQRNLAAAAEDTRDAIIVDTLHTIERITPPMAWWRRALAGIGLWLIEVSTR